MASSAKLLIALGICIAMAATMGPGPASAALTCPRVQTSMMPCMQYLITIGARPSTKCCDSVKSLVSSASTTADRRIACGCLKDAAQRFKNIIPANAAKLPSSCSANIPYKISPTTDCNKIN